MVSEMDTECVEFFQLLHRVIREITLKLGYLGSWDI